MEQTYDGDIFDAIEFGDFESVKMHWKASIDIDYRGKSGNTMLMLATYYGFEDIVEYLLSKGANLSLTNAQGKTVIDIAKEKGHSRILEVIKMSN